MGTDPDRWSARVLVILLCLMNLCFGKIFEKCELAAELKFTYNLTAEQVQNYVCIAQYESTFNTEAVNRYNWDGSKDYGLFQLNGRYWCGSEYGKNECNIPCSDLLDDNLEDDLMCVQKIIKDTEKWMKNDNGLIAWVAYVKYCQNEDLNKYIEECSDALSPPLVTDTTSNDSDSVIENTDTQVPVTKPEKSSTTSPSRASAIGIDTTGPEKPTKQEQPTKVADQLPDLSSASNDDSSQSELPSRASGLGSQKLSHPTRNVAPTYDSPLDNISPPKGGIKISDVPVRTTELGVSDATMQPILLFLGGLSPPKSSIQIPMYNPWEEVPATTSGIGEIANNYSYYDYLNKLRDMAKTKNRLTSTISDNKMSKDPLTRTHGIPIKFEFPPFMKKDFPGINPFLQKFEPDPIKTEISADRNIHRDCFIYLDRMLKENGAKLYLVPATSFDSVPMMNDFPFYEFTNNRFFSLPYNRQTSLPILINYPLIHESNNFPMHEQIIRSISLHNPDQLNSDRPDGKENVNWRSGSSDLFPGSVPYTTMSLDDRTRLVEGRQRLSLPTQFLLDGKLKKPSSEDFYKKLFKPLPNIHIKPILNLKKTEKLQHFDKTFIKKPSIEVRPIFNLKKTVNKIDKDLKKELYPIKKPTIQVKIGKPFLFWKWKM